MSKRVVRPSRQSRKPPRAPRKEAAITAVPHRGADVSESEADALIPGRIRAETQVARGPAKRRSAASPPPRLLNHKSRATWFRARAAWPVREAPVARVIREREFAMKSLPAAPGTSQWEAIGPTNIGGRLTCLVCDPARPDRIWVGAAGGGVWHSADAGQTWRAQWHDEDVLNVGALAIDPSNPDVLYCGTGEANLSADSYGGVGLYRTLDGGATWRLHASCEKVGIPRRIGVIAIDPFDPRHIIIGGVGFNEVTQRADLGGMYVSRDAGVTWARETFVSTSNYWCHAVVFHPTRAGVVFATVTNRGPASGIYKSSDGGVHWTQLTKGLPPSERIGRTSLAISPSNPDVLYAFASDMLSESADLLLGVFRTANGGSSWTDISGTHFRREGQISYGNTIAVHPTKPNHVLCGGVDLHLTTNGGKTWKYVTRWDARRGSKGYAHADHHGVVMPVSAPGRVYDPNDGGLDISDDGGVTWKNRSSGLAVTMYYDADVAQSDERSFGGGAQDNGTLITTSGRPDDHFEILGGDGGWIVFDPTDASHLFASYYNLNVFRYRGNTNKDVSPPAGDDEKNSIWMAFLVLDPTNPNIIFAGSNRVWRSRNDGDTWTPVSATLDGSPISALEVSRADNRRLYVGTENGGFFRSLDGGNAWSANMAGPLPGHTITRLAAAPDKVDRVFATVANFGHSHVYRSDDGGRTWADVDRRQLPDVPHHSIAIPARSPATVYVCNDVGVFVSTDAGMTWMNLTRNLPRVMVVDIVYHAKTGGVYVATYGRSMFRLAAPNS
jgi:photosystem II stability/assembly factor-like uncharacterized protein